MNHTTHQIHTPGFVPALYNSRLDTIAMSQRVAWRYERGDFRRELNIFKRRIRKED